MTQMKIADLLDRSNTYAVVGATPNTEKYGYKVCHDLIEKGYHVIPINPNHQTICGLQAYPTVLDVPGKIDVAVLVVPPDRARKVMPAILEKKITKIWFQPGSEDDSVLSICERHGISTVYNSCVMIQASPVKTTMSTKTIGEGDNDDD